MIRVYFNRHSEAPNVWSVDLGDQSSEINVQRIVKVEVPFTATIYKPEIAGRDRYTPRAVEHVYGASLIVRYIEGQLIAFLINSNRPDLLKWYISGFEEIYEGPRVC